MDATKNIDILFRARYPLIAVVTHEESRVVGLLEQVASGRGAELIVWSLTHGGKLTGEDKATDPAKALAAIEKRNDGAALYVLKDFHPFLNDAGIVRKLRDLAEALKGRKQTIVLLGPVLKIPPELEKDIHVVDWDLPAREEVAALATQMATELKLNADNLDAAIDAALGLTITEARNAFAKSAVQFKGLVAAEIAAEKQQIVKKSGLLEYVNTTASMSDVGGHIVLKQWLVKRGKAFSPKAREYGLPAPKGVLLVGPPGAGKSLVAKVIASMWGMPLIKFDVGKVFGSLVGQSEANIRQVIKVAEACAPCVIWIDELEKAFAGTSGAGDSGTSSRVFGSFLQWLQDHEKPVFVVATANNVRALPAELLRKGRFDEIFFCDLPTEDERKEILDIHLRKRGRKPDDGRFDLDSLAQSSSQFTGAELEQAVVSALYEAFADDREVAGTDILNAIKDTVPIARQMEEQIEAMRDWAKYRARPTNLPTTPGHRILIDTN